MVEKKTEYIKLNEEFYRAFESLDIKKMEMIWINMKTQFVFTPDGKSLWDGIKLKKAG